MVFHSIFAGVGRSWVFVLVLFVFRLFSFLFLRVEHFLSQHFLSFQAFPFSGTWLKREGFIYDFFLGGQEKLPIGVLGLLASRASSLRCMR